MVLTLSRKYKWVISGRREKKEELGYVRFSIYKGFNIKLFQSLLGLLGATVYMYVS